MNVDRLLAIVESPSEDFRTLSEIASGQRRSFYRGANFSGVDLRNEDLSGFDLTGANFTASIYDEATLIDSRFRMDLRRKGTFVPSKRLRVVIITSGAMPIEPTLLEVSGRYPHIQDTSLLRIETEKVNDIEQCENRLEVSRYAIFLLREEAIPSAEGIASFVRVWRLARSLRSDFSLRGLRIILGASGESLACLHGGKEYVLRLDPPNQVECRIVAGEVTSLFYSNGNGLEDNINKLHGNLSNSNDIDVQVVLEGMLRTAYLKHAISAEYQANSYGRDFTVRYYRTEAAIPLVIEETLSYWYNNELASSRKNDLSAKPIRR